MEVLRQIDRSFWWDVAENCPYATFYHSPLWHALAEQTHPEKASAPIGAVCNNGTRMVLPLLKIETSAKGLLKSYISTFAWCYGGIIADGPTSIQDRRRLYEAALGGRTDRIVLVSNPIEKPHHESGWPGLFDEVDTEDDFTQLLTLDRPLDDLIVEFSHGHKRNLNKAKRKGVTIRQASSLSDYRAYFGAYEDSLRRWGDTATSRYPWKLFEEGYRLQEQYPDHIRLWLAEVDDTVIAGTWTFYWNAHSVEWHSAAYEKYFDYCANFLLKATILEDAIDRGYAYYDFNPSGGHEGVVEFKRQFGTEKWPLQRCTLTSYKSTLVEKIRSHVHDSTALLRTGAS